MPAAVDAATTYEEDFVASYVEDLRNVVDMEVIRARGAASSAVDPLGGAGVHYWEPINTSLQLNIDRRERDGRSDLFVHDGGS